MSALYIVLRSLFLPPLLQFWGALLGWWLWRRGRRWAGGGVLLVSGLSLYLMATPLGASLLARVVETEPALALADRAQWQSAQAIVVLGGGREADAPEYGMDTVSWATLVRLRYGAYLYRKTGLPILVTGGAWWPGQAPESALMADTLVRDFVVNVRWQESRSRTTWENAQFSAAMLKAEGVHTVLLVTQASHMFRSRLAFETAGLKVIAAPTDFQTEAREGPAFRRWLISPGAFAYSGAVLHELVGTVYYRLRRLF